MTKKLAAIISLSLIITILSSAIVLNATHAQSNGTAFLSVTAAGVELQRDGTDLWVTVNVESVVGPGDRIRTNGAGQGTITFIASDLMVELGPSTEFVIQTLQRDGETYRVTVEVVKGSTAVQVDGESGVEHTFEVITPGASLAFSVATFMVDVDVEGVTKVLAQEGTLNITAGDNVQEVEAGNGMRIDQDSVASSVLPVSSVEQLDTAIDGLSAVFTIEADVSLNVRQGPDRSQTIIGSVDPGDIDRVLGVSEDGNWYRIRLNDGFGWVSGVGITVAVDKSVLVAFPAEYQEVVAVPPSTETTTSADTVTSNEPQTEATTEQAAVVSDYSEEELNLLAAMNDWRLQEGLSPFKPNPILTQMARDHATYLVSLSSFPLNPHLDAAGRQLFARALTDQYNWPHYSSTARVSIGENIWVGASINSAMNYWQTDNIHRLTALDTGYREIGVAAAPHRWGHMYVVIMGSRPDVFPVLVDPDQGIMYLTDEEYRYASGGDWIVNLTDYQIMTSAGDEPDDSAWQPFEPQVALPSTEPFGIAFRGDDHVVVAQVDPTQDIVVLSSNIPAADTEVSN